MKLQKRKTRILELVLEKLIPGLRPYEMIGTRDGLYWVEAEFSDILKNYKPLEGPGVWRTPDRKYTLYLQGHELSVVPESGIGFKVYADSGTIWDSVKALQGQDPIITELLR